MKRVRLLLWVLVALAVGGTAALLLLPRGAVDTPGVKSAAQRNLGGPFTLVDGNGRLFSSEKLAGTPYAIYFGFTRCGDVCPTTLSRLVRLRKEAARDDALRIVFVTIDPAHDGPSEVGQYAGLFNAPIISLTGSQAQIDQVKKKYGIYAEPEPHAAMGKEMAHTATVLLFDRNGRFVTTISPEESDGSALDKLRRLAT